MKNSNLQRTTYLRISEITSGIECQEVLSKHTRWKTEAEGFWGEKNK